MRRNLQRLIFAGCRDLGLDTETRRELQLVATGKASLADMDEADMRRVLDALKARGFQADGRPQRHPRAPRADLRLVHVLWSRLAQEGKLDNPTRAGLNAFVRRRFGDAWGVVPADIDMLRDQRQIADLIEALKEWCEREGVAIERTPYGLGA